LIKDLNKILVIGNGSLAANITRGLLEENAEVIVMSIDGSLKPSILEGFENLGKGKPEILENAELITCDGYPGNFELKMKAGAEKININTACIIVAEEAIRKDHFSVYNLQKSPFAVSFTELSENETDADSIVFLTGLKTGGHPAVHEEIMRKCLDFQRDGNKKTFILTNNLNVAGSGLEELYRETKEAGTVYAKISGEMPEISQDGDGRVSIELFDEILQEKLNLSPDLTVLDERITPSGKLEKLSEVLRIDRDRSGFIQSDNVHRLSVFTNRKGILAAGSSRGVHTPEGVHLDEGNAVISALYFINGERAEPECYAEVMNSDGCARCLTCYRICPYSAISLDSVVDVMPEACEGCGICIAECPRHTIEMKGKDRFDISDRVAGVEINNEVGGFMPQIIAFCCSRSAVRAKELSMEEGCSLPEGLKIIEVPCAGSVSQGHIFKAIKKGADGILIMTCHEGNCHSERGNILVNGRVETTLDFLANTAYEKERLSIKTIASNMGREFWNITTCFEQLIKDLGPSRMKK